MMTKYIAAMVVMGGSLLGQTKVDYPTQLKNMPIVVDTAYTTLAEGCAFAANFHAILNVTKSWTNVPTTPCNAFVNFIGTVARIQPASGAIFTMNGYSAISRRQVWDVSLGGTVRLAGLAAGSPIYAGNFTSMAGACDTASTGTATLTVNTPVTIAADTSCAANVYAGPDGLITVNNTFTLTMDGSFNGDLSQHFAKVGSGAVAFTAPQGPMSPLWFGASVSASDNTSAYAFLMASLPSGGTVVNWPCGGFKGSFIFPSYPKSVTAQGQGPCSILEESSANSGIVSSSPITANYTSGNNQLLNFSLKPHNSSTTSKAVDMRGQNHGTYQHLWFFPATNATGHFGWGFYCSTATALYTACYENRVDDVVSIAQVGPTIMAETEEFAAVNTWSRFVIISNTGMTKGFFFNSPVNELRDSDFEGNASATMVVVGGGYVHMVDNWMEGNDKDIVGQDNGYQLSVEGGNLAVGFTSTVSCNDQSGWSFRNVQGINSVADLPGCQNATVSVGSSIDGLAPRALIGGLTTTTITPRTSGTLIEVPGVSGGLAAGTYTYNVTAQTSGGESDIRTLGPITISNHSSINMTLAAVTTAPAFHIYGRVCPTTATCKSLIAVVSQGNDGGGMWLDDGTLTPSGNSPNTVRNSSGDLNVQGSVGSAGAAAAYFYTSSGINYGTDISAADRHLIWNPQNGPNFTFQGATFAPTFQICMMTTHALLPGGNDIIVLGNTINIKKGTDFAADLGTPIAAGNPVCLLYNDVHNVFQYQGQ